LAANTGSFSSVVPSGTSSIRQGDDDIRSFKSTFQNVVGDEHYCDQTSASSASGGIHKPGSARAFFGTRASLATPASADSAGRLYFSTDLGSLHYLAASSHSTLVGGSRPMGSTRTQPDAIVVGSGTTTAIGFVASEYDVGGYFASSATTATIPLGQAGHHIFTASVQFPSTTTTSVRRLAIRRATIVIAESSSYGTHIGGSLSVTAFDQSSAGSQYDVVVFHNTGVNETMPAVGRFSVQKV
jgi:hypothetical protein